MDFTFSYILLQGAEPKALALTGNLVTSHRNLELSGKYVLFRRYTILCSSFEYVPINYWS